MSSSLPGTHEVPASQYDLSTYWGRVKQSAQISDPRTLFVSSAGLENAKRLITSYKTGSAKHMTPELWQAKKIVDSTLHPDTGLPILLPFRMSSFILTNLLVTAGMLTPALSTRGTLAWQITNQSLNVCINSANANKSTPLPPSKLLKSYLLAVSASCSVAVGLNALVPRLKWLPLAGRVVAGRLVPFAAVASAGALNVFLMRSEEMRRGIDVFPSSAPKTSPSLSPSSSPTDQAEETTQIEPPPPKSLGKSPLAARIAVSETALSRVLNATPIMVLPPLILVRLQQREWLKRRPRLVLPVNLGLIFVTSVFALPLALGAFPQREVVRGTRLEREFWGGGDGDGDGDGGWVEFNRGI